MSPTNNILHDFYDCFKNSHIWCILSFYDIKTRYRRTVIGPFWLTLGTAITVFGMGLVWGSIFGMNIREFLPYIAAGMIIWTFISAVLNEGCSVFTSQAGIIHNVKTSYFIHIMTMLSRNLIIMAHNMLVLVAVFIICGKSINFEILWFFPALILLILNSFWVGIVLGICATRYRDISCIVGNIVALIMLVTPIMWKPEMLKGSRRLIASVNPFAHVIDIVRDPLLGNAPSATSYCVVLGILTVGMVFALWLYKKYIHRIVFWM